MRRGMIFLLLFRRFSVLSFLKSVYAYLLIQSVSLSGGAIFLELA